MKEAQSAGLCGLYPAAGFLDAAVIKTFCFFGIVAAAALRNRSAMGLLSACRQPDFSDS
jgi:hypothetical protein